MTLGIMFEDTNSSDNVYDMMSGRGNSNSNSSNNNNYNRNGSNKRMRDHYSHNGARSRSRKRVVPNGFTLAGAAKETHGHPIYCVDWSNDLYEMNNNDNDDDDGSNHIAVSNNNSESLTTDGCSSSETTTNNNNNNNNSSDTNNHHQNGYNSSNTSTGQQSKTKKKKKKMLCRCFATCAGNYLTVYEDPCFVSQKSPNQNGDNGSSKNNSNRLHRNNGGFNIRQVYKDVDEEEIYYICAFGGRSSIGTLEGKGPTQSYVQSRYGETKMMTNSNGSNSNDSAIFLPDQPTDDKLLNTNEMMMMWDGPQLLCVAGRRGIIKVVDTVRRALLMTLSGHGDEIYDLKFNPNSSHNKDWLLLSASKDESIRLWNVQTATCVAIFAGHAAHRDSVLSLSWHPLGTMFASSGMDTSVKVWSITDSSLQSAIIKSRQQQQQPTTTTTTTTTTDNTKKFHTVHEQVPIFATNKMHTDYVDCVQFVGDLILSKSIANCLSLWKPANNSSNNNSHSSSSNKKWLCDSVVPLRDFSLANCDVWFIRFHTDRSGRMLAIGNTKGEIKIWEVGTQKHPFASLSHTMCTSTIRMVSFSQDGSSLIAACDDSTVWKWDAYL